MRFTAAVVLFVIVSLATREGLAQTTNISSTGRFEFHSDPWINLHHFLYQWARDESGLGADAQRVSVPERSTLYALPANERDRWQRVVAFYKDTIAERSHWDLELLRLKRDLLLLRGDVSASPPDRISGISPALQSAMPVYRKWWWLQHDRVNRKWISVVVPPLLNHEERFVQLTRRLNRGATWPRERWRVDVSAYANGRAGYTTQEGHVVIYSTDPRVQNLYGVEIVLHEIQHASVVAGAFDEDVGRAFNLAGTRVPPNLSHAIIFATAGEFTQTIAESERLPKHIPYWIREGFENRDGWSELIQPLSEHWTPVVRGEKSQEEGLSALTAALKVPLKR